MLLEVVRMLKMSKLITENMEYAISTAFEKVFVDKTMPLTHENLVKMTSLASKTYNLNMGTNVTGKQVMEWIVFESSLRLYLTKIKFAGKVKNLQKK